MINKKKLDLSSVEGLDAIDFSKKFSRIENYNFLFEEFKKCIQKYYQTDNIMIGSGIDELIDVLLLFFKFKFRLNKILIFDPSYGRYAQSAQRFNFEIKTFSRFIFKNNTFRQTSIEEIIEFVNKNNLEIILFSNPGNPTPDFYLQNDILKLLNNISSRTVVIIDEAFVEYAVKDDTSSSLTLLDKFPNLFILRTFSKAYGLFGLRIGCLFSKNSLNDIANYKRLYTITQPSIEVFLEIFQLQKFRQFRKDIYVKNQERKKLFLEYFYKNITNFSLYVGEANFVLVFGRSPIKNLSFVKCKDVTNKFNIKNYYFYRMTIPELNQIPRIDI